MDIEFAVDAFNIGPYGAGGDNHLLGNVGNGEIAGEVTQGEKLPFC